MAQQLASDYEQLALDLSQSMLEKADHVGPLERPVLFEHQQLPF